LYLPENLTASYLQDPVLLDLPDSLWCTFRTDSSSTCVVAVIYRPPNATPSMDDKLLKALEFIGTKNYTNVLILGDFNLPQINFELINASGSTNSMANRFFSSTVNLGLTEHIQDSTRWRQGNIPSRLDFVLSNEPTMVENVSRLAPLGLSDHVVVNFDFICNTTWLETSPRTHYAFYRADYHAIRESLSRANWGCDQVMTVDEHWMLIKSIIQQAIEEQYPSEFPALKDGITGCEEELVNS
jgi:hypothetical protein